MPKPFVVEKKVCTRLPTQFGSFELCLFMSNIDDKEHLALIKGELSGKENVLVRIHSECFTGDILGSQRCDCGEQLQNAMRLIEEKGEGVILYLRQEGRGIGLLEKLKAYNLQDDGLDTVDANLALGHHADARDYGIAAAMLKLLKIKSIQLITNNPEKIRQLGKYGIDVINRISAEATISKENAGYLFTKAFRMNHLLNLDGLELEIRSNGNGNKNY
jgi:3,4-dihydroxy 2-butanone 4-phosphate synthase/GTP cyclohydrolase II